MTFEEIINQNYDRRTALQIEERGLRRAEIQLRAYVVAFAECVGDDPERVQAWVGDVL